MRMIVMEGVSFERHMCAWGGGEWPRNESVCGGGEWPPKVCVCVCVCGGGGSGLVTCVGGVAS